MKGVGVAFIVVFIQTIVFGGFIVKRWGTVIPELIIQLLWLAYMFAVSMRYDGNSTMIQNVD